MTVINDQERLRAVELSGLLRHEMGRRMVHICYTATALLDVDASQLNVITADQQIFVAEWPRARRDPVGLENSGCREVVAAQETLAVSNTIYHPVMCQMPWSATWGGYLGAPIRFHDQVLGSLCVLTHDPRDWKRTDIMALESLAKLVEYTLEHPE